MTTPDLLIDTSLFIDHVRQKSKVTALTRSLAEYGIGAVSVVTRIEYETGEIHAKRLPRFFKEFAYLVLLPLSEQVLHRAPFIQARNLAINKKMDFADLFIAATALYHEIPLLTLNADDFQYVKNLRLLKVQ